MDLSFKTLANSNDPILPAIEQIYLDSIPASGRKPLTWLRELPNRPDYQVLVATDSTIPIAFSILFHPPHDHFALLEYFAVAASYRNRGIGSALFQQTLKQTGSRILIIEVEAEGAGSRDVCEQSRRVAFYRRNGCCRIANLIYRLPLDTSPPPMNLFLANPPSSFSHQTLARWLIKIYREVYDRPAEDPRLAEMLADLRSPVGFD